MKKIKDKIVDFYSWVKGAELVELEHINIKEDPIRPHLSLKFRTSNGRQIFGLQAKDKIQGIVCVAWCSSMPKSESGLRKMSTDKRPKTHAIAYTVWSRKRGAGRKIITALRDHINKERPDIQKMFTLSPLTPMATHFHIKNGARLVSINADTQNFQYKLKAENGEKRKD